MKKGIVISSIILAGLFTGCSAETEIQKRLVNELEQDERYSQYVDLKEKGLLDESNYYISQEQEMQEAVEVMAQPIDYVVVTFARNPYVSVKYYYDAELTNEITDDVCRLKSGESVYAGDAQIKGEKNGLYELIGYNVFKYEDGERLIEVSANEENKNKVYTVNEKLKGGTIAIEPVGKYVDRKIYFHAYAIGENNETTEVNGGTWVINGVPQASNKEAEISPRAPYTVGFEYADGSAAYYVDRTEPDYFGDPSKSDTLGFEFQQTATYENITDYTVWLHEYYQIVFSSKSDDAIEKVKVLNRNGTTSELNAPVSNVTKLKEKDEVIITLNDDYSLISEDIDISAPEHRDESFVYRLTIGGTKQEINFDIKSSKEIHITEKFYDKKGGKLLSQNEIKDDDKIWYEITTDDEYYFINNKDSLTGNCKYGEYRKNLNNLLGENMKEYITVKLPTADRFGTFTYRQGDRVITVAQDNTAKIREDKLEMTYSLSSPQDYTLYKKSNPKDPIYNLGKHKTQTATIEFNDLRNQLESGLASDFLDYANIAVKAA